MKSLSAPRTPETSDLLDPMPRDILATKGLSLIGYLPSSAMPVIDAVILTLDDILIMMLAQARSSS